MSIEFRCTQCQKLLRVADETAGKPAKCPSCGTIVQIPAPGAMPGLGGAPPPQQPSWSNPVPPVQQPPASPPPAAGGNFGGLPPYGPPPQQPAAGFGANPYQAPPYPAPMQSAPPIATGKIEVGDVINRAWAIFQKQMGSCVLAPLAGGFALAGCILAGVVIGVLFGFVFPPLGVLVVILVYIAGIIASIALNVSLKEFYLRVARGERPTIGSIFRFHPQFLPFLGASILFGMMYGIGFALCVVPGIFVALYMGQFASLIVDGRAGAIESFSLSMRITEGNRLQIFLLMLASAGIILLGELACFVGVFFAIPLVQLCWAVAYLRMTGQQTGDQLP